MVPRISRCQKIAFDKYKQQREYKQNSLKKINKNSYKNAIPIRIFD